MGPLKAEPSSYFKVSGYLYFDLSSSRKQSIPMQLSFASHDLPVSLFHFKFGKLLISIQKEIMELFRFYFRISCQNKTYKADGYLSML